jgi:hypothetical protein
VLLKEVSLTGDQDEMLNMMSSTQRVNRERRDDERRGEHTIVENGRPQPTALDRVVENVPS